MNFMKTMTFISIYKTDEYNLLKLKIIEKMMKKNISSKTNKKTDFVDSLEIVTSSSNVKQMYNVH